MFYEEGRDVNKTLEMYNVQATVKESIELVKLKLKQELYAKTESVNKTLNKLCKIDIS